MTIKSLWRNRKRLFEMAKLDHALVINVPLEKVFWFKNSIKKEIWLVIKSFHVKRFPEIAERPKISGM